MLNPAHLLIQSYTQKYSLLGIDDESPTENNITLFNYTWVGDDLICIFDETLGEFVTSTFFKIFVFIMYTIIFAFALTGNGLVCFVVHTSPRMKTVTNFFIVNLAIGDILMTVFCVPFSFVPILVLRYWPFGSIMCRVVNYSQAVSVLVSAYTLLAISIDRYLAIVQPLKPRLSKAGAKVVVVAVWAGALATASPIGIVAQLHRPSLWHIACDVDVCGELWADLKQSERYSLALLTLQFALPLSALVATYARIAYVVWAVQTPGEAQSERDTRMQNSKRKMVKMMVAVVAVFIVCWLPLNIFILLWTFYSSNDSWNLWPGMPYVWFASHWLAMSHTCYNPIIYCYMNNKYRHGFKQVFNNLMCIKLNSSRSCHRSSACGGIPLSGETCYVSNDFSNYPLTCKTIFQCICANEGFVDVRNEMMGVSTQGRRIGLSGKIRISHASNEDCECSKCICIRREIIKDGVSGLSPLPAQPLSVRSEFI